MVYAYPIKFASNPKSLNLIKIKEAPLNEAFITYYRLKIKLLTSDQHYFQSNIF